MRARCQRGDARTQRTTRRAITHDVGTQKCAREFVRQRRAIDVAGRRQSRNRLSPVPLIR
jgi:hypothetical protein